MTAARIPLLEPERSAEAAAGAGVPGYFAGVNLYRALLQHPELTKPIADLVVFLWRRSSLDARLRELVIMRVAWLVSGEYVWAQHWPMALRLGLTADELVAVRDWRASDRFGPTDSAVLAATDETLTHGAVGDSTYQQLSELLGDVRTVLELLATISTWRMVSELASSMGVPLEESFPSWPPDGLVPEPASASVGQRT